MLYNKLYSFSIISARGVVLEARIIKEVKTKQELKIKILTTNFKGNIITGYNYLEGQKNYDNYYKKGDLILVDLLVEKKTIRNCRIIDYYRFNYYIFLFIIFLLFVLLIGKKQGFNALLSIIICIIIIFFFVLPLFLKNYNPVIIGIIFSLISLFVSFKLITRNKKIFLSAFFGAFLSLFISFILLIFIFKFLYLDKFFIDLYRELLLMSRMYIPLTIENIILIFIFSAIISCLGIVMDTSITIASSIYEIYSTTNNIDNKTLFESGINIGKDIFGTMANAYVLIFAGQFLTMLIFFKIIKFPFIRIINLQPFASELVMIFIGLFCMFLTIFITSFLSVILLKNKKESVFSLYERF
ncbi:MAG TPA: YibE/F family protein [bacterium]|nr:YibE/F family protein [bacterium]